MFRALLCAHLLHQGRKQGCPVPGKVIPAPTADLTVATINLSSVNNNRFEYIRDLGDERASADFARLSEAYGNQDADQIVGLIYTPAMFQNLKQTLGISDKFNNLYSRYAVMTIPEFMTSEALEKSRAVSLIDREETFVERPSIFGRMTDFTLKPVDFVHKWNLFMKDKSVAPIPSRYDKDLERHGIPYRDRETVLYQLVSLAVFDLVAYVQLQRAIAQTKIDIQALVHRLDRAMACKDDVLLELVAYRAKQLAPAVICIQEASTLFLEQLRRKLSKDFVVLFPPGSKPKTTQQVGLVVSTKLDPRRFRIIDAAVEWDTRTMYAVINVQNVPVVVGSHHAKADPGDATAKFEKVVNVANNIGISDVIFGMDSNAVTRHKNKAVRVNVDAIVKSLGGDTSPLINTTNRIRSQIGIQPSKNGEVDQNPKDLVAWVSTNFQAMSFHMDSSGSTKSLDDWLTLTTPIPSVAFPTDHAMVAARFAIRGHDIDEY